jgi:hypothetical protein
VPGWRWLPDGPKHSRLFETRADHLLACGFDYTRANKQVLAAKLGIAHTLRISFEVVCLGANLLGHLGIGGVDGPQHAHQFFDFSLVQQALLVNFHPSFLFDFLMGIHLARHLPQMLASMVEIDNLDRARKVFGDKIPDPFGAIADDDFLFRTAPTTFPRFSIDAFAKLYRGFYGAGVGGGI